MKVIKVIAIGVFHRPPATVSIGGIPFLFDYTEQYGVERKCEAFAKLQITQNEIAVTKVGFATVDTRPPAP